jgi:SNF2 family DNA or RNA helicase
MIDKGLFGKSFYAWRNNYCYSFGYGNYQWAMRKDKDQLFTDKLNTISEVVRKEDVLDLPGKTENIRDVQLDKYERDVYDTMKKDLIVEFGEKESVAANAAVKMMKLREATSGFLINNDGSISRTGESKLKELSSLLAEIGNHQVIIWTQFHYEAAQIMELLKGKSAVRIDGTIPNQNIKNANLQSFKSGDAQYLIAHPASLGHGVTLVNCNYAVYFSLSHSYELQVQSMDRIYRKGQHNCCTYYFLLAVNSVDKVIMKALKNKQSTAEAVLHYLQKKGDF